MRKVAPDCSHPPATFSSHPRQNDCCDTFSCLYLIFILFMLKSVFLALLGSVALPVILSDTSAGVPGPDGSLNPCHGLTDLDAIDTCYMRLALEHVMIHNPQFPFGALIVDHTTNEISCFGANSNRKNKLLHGNQETKVLLIVHWLTLSFLYRNDTCRRDDGFLEVSEHWPVFCDGACTTEE